MRFVSCSLALLLLSGCSLVPFYETPKQVVPEQWSQAQPAAAVPQLHWDQFGSTQLGTLVTQALANNQDVEIAAARVEQARAQVVIAGGPLYPAIDASGSGQYSNSRASGLNNGSKDIRAGATVSYEVDVWGLIRANRNSANARFEASQFDRDGVALAVATETARNYLSYVATLAQLDVARNNLATAQDLLNIVEAQFKEGRVSELEYSQQKVVLSNVQASIAALKNNREVFRNTLAVLVGVPASGFAPSEEAFTSITNPPLAANQPAELITRRPDIRSSEASLRAANFDVGVARASLLPSLSISAGAAIATDPTTVLTNALAALSAPIFRGGALSAAVDLSEAQKRELVASYQQVILISFQEVENALAARQAAQQRQVYFNTAVTDADHAYALAKTRYVNGSIDFQTLINTQQSLFSAQANNVQVKLEALSSTLDLFRALGGDGEK